MSRFTLVLCISAILWPNVLAVTVFEAMQSANAGLFAQWIEQDPQNAALYSSTQVKTVFAPNDDAFQAYNESGQLPQLRRLLTRVAIGTEEGAKHACEDQKKMSTVHGDPPQQFNNFEKSGNPNRNQAVVVQPSQPSNGTSSKRKRQNTEDVRIYSGLGNTVSVVQANIPYDGGFVHTIDGFVLSFPHFKRIIVRMLTLRIVSSLLLNLGKTPFPMPTQRLSPRDLIGPISRRLCKIQRD